MKETNCNFLVKGKKVVGTICLPDGNTKAPVVLLIHGFTGNRHESVSKSAPLGKFSLLASKLSDVGIASLRIDMRGSGQSDGSLEDITAFTELEDAIAACEYLKQSELVDGNKISVLGLSFGGLVATALCAKDRKIKSLVLWNPAVNMMEVMLTIAGIAPVMHACKDEHRIYEFDIWNAKRKLCGEFFTSLCKMSAHASIAKYKGPMLLQVGLNDRVVWPEPAQAQGIISCHEGEHELQTVNAGHDFTNNGSDEPLLSVIEKTVSFLKEKAF